MNCSTHPHNRRNVIDYYKYWDNDAIIADLDTRRFNFSILISNLFHDFNISCVIRNANAFMAKNVIIYGRKKYDHRGCVGTHNYTRFRHVRENDNLQELTKEFDDVVGIDNVSGALPIEEHKWDYSKKLLLCFGQEDVGIPQEMLDICNKILYIKQYGSVRSLNVACASSITMFHYCMGLK